MAHDALNQALAQVFNNGVGQVGLEVGSDPGLPPSDWVHIPKSMGKQTAFKVHPDAMSAWPAVAAVLNPGAPLGGNSVEEFDDAYSAFGKFGWVATPNAKVVVHDGKKYAKVGAVQIQVTKAIQRAPTVADMMAFYTVNRAATRPAIFVEKENHWVNAVRFWSVVAGLVTAGKSMEYKVVDDPLVTADGAEDFAGYATKFHAQSLTACAARAGNWRKTNHATGGPIATGFADRWLRKEGFTADGAADKDKNDVRKRITDAFYVATHAASVHAVLALMAPGDKGHWAEIDPSYGVMIEWEILESVRIRLEGPTQVAGAAIIADSMVVAKTLIREGLGPLLNAKSQMNILVAKYAELEHLGVRGGIYAKWFMAGHPEGIEAAPFVQRGAGCDDLCGELGYVATKYYSTSSIGKSPALASAAAQLGMPEAADTWSSLAASKKTMSSTQIVAAYKVVKGASATQDVSDISSSDPAKVSAAVRAYNRITMDLAAQASVLSSVNIDEAKVLAALSDSGNRSPKGGMAAVAAA